MNIRDISKPVTAKALNESLAKKFGQKIKLENFTLEQLQDARNKVRTKLSQVEMNENFDAVIKNESYQKSKLFLDVLNAAIAEREDIAEGDYANDAQRKAVHAAKDKKKKKANESTIVEGAEDAAELVMAAKDMVDRVTGWMEDTAEMQTESMLELADAIRDEMGSEKSEAFVSSIKPALESLYAAMESTRGTLTSGVGMLTGEEEPMNTMGDEPVEEPPMEPTIDGEEGGAEGDIPLPDFDAADAAAGGEEEAGRARRESKQYNKKKIAEQSRKLATVLSKKK